MVVGGSEPSPALGPSQVPTLSRHACSDAPSTVRSTSTPPQVGLLPRHGRLHPRNSSSDTGADCQLQPMASQSDFARGALSKVAGASGWSPSVHVVNSEHQVVVA